MKRPKQHQPLDTAQRVFLHNGNLDLNTADWKVYGDPFHIS